MDTTIQDLDSALARPEEVERLRLSQLAEIPAAIFDLPRLVDLDLSFERFGDAFDRIARLGSLRSLRLQVCWADLDSLPPALFELAALQTFHLDVWNSRLGSLEGLGALAGLEELQVRGSGLQALSSDLGTLSRLRKLDLSKMRRIGPPPPGLDRLASLEDVSLSEWDLAEFPAFLCRLPALRRLRLYDVPIRSLPEEISRLEGLVDLDVRAHQLEALPESLGRLRALGRLHLVGSAYLDTDTRAPLTEVPESLGDLAGLTVLDLSSNSIRRVPASLARCRRLRYLNLSRNELSDLPELGSSALEHLCLSHNRFPSLPAWILSTMADHLSGLQVETNPFDVETRRRLVALGLTVGEAPWSPPADVPAPGDEGATLAAKLAAEPLFELVPLDSAPRAVASLRGSREVLVATEDAGIVAVDVATRAVRPLENALTDCDHAPVRAASLAAGGNGRVLVADIHSVHRARVDGERVDEDEEPIDLGSDTCTAGFVSVACARERGAAAATAWESLVNLTEPRDRDGLILPEGQPRFTRIAASADGAWIATGRESGLVELRSPSTLDVRAAFEGLQAPVLSLAFSPDGRWLAAGDDTTRLRLWDVETGRSTPLQGLGKVVAFDWLSDSSALVAVGLTRHVGVFLMTDLSTPRVHWPEGFETRYFTDGALLEDRWMAIAVEDTGILVVDLRPAE